MNWRAQAMGMCLLGLVRALTGAQARWYGCPPKAEVIPVPVLCSVTFGEPVTLGANEDRAAFLRRAREAVLALRAV